MARREERRRRGERKEWEKGDERRVEEGEEQWFVDAHTHIYKENFPDKPWIPESFWRSFISIYTELLVSFSDHNHH